LDLHLSPPIFFWNNSIFLLFRKRIIHSVIILQQQPGIMTATTSHLRQNVSAAAAAIDNRKDHNNPVPVHTHIVFIHLDLGIGGAEQLVIQLAKASRDLGHTVDIVTTRCDQDHCFAAVKQPDGELSNNVYVYGRWIPPNIFGVATALMSTLRMIYLAYKVVTARDKPAEGGRGRRHHKSADMVVVDVLPTALPLFLTWMSSAGVLFYCHFPDKLLLRNNWGGILKKLYRRFLDAVEEYTMGLSDTLVVNSRFTLGMVEEHFPVLSTRRKEQKKSQRIKPIEVLYPALDTSNMVQSNNRDKTNQSPIVSLNRFERKKNIGLLIQAYACMKNENINTLPPLVIAGGYDTQNAENVEYRGELGRLAKELGVSVDFRLDITDAERATLFQTALCVVYTPDKEHFGIVPLEAMFAGTPVLAVSSGGPLETIRDGDTGFLREPTPEAFGDALLVLIGDPDRATQMGQKGRKHVEATFGTKRFETEWQLLVEETKAAGMRRRSYGNELVVLANLPRCILQLLITRVVLLLLTWIFRQMGMLAPSESIMGAFRSRLLGDEL
jgi:alpha-1,3/alpha-1,6-mannosyltransferase